MAYQATPYTRQRQQEVRARILEASQELLREGGYAAAQIDAIATRAGVASGTVYRHFPSKADLFEEVFRVMSAREVAAMSAALEGPGSAEERIAGAITAFARRALRGRRAAYALIAEPVDLAVDEARLVFRRTYAEVIAQAIRAGVAAGELPAQNPALTAAALVGALAEALLGPLAVRAAHPHDESTIAGLLTFCLRAITGKEPTPCPPPTTSPTNRRPSRATTRSRPTARSSRA